jgi:hypothetical protein
MKCPHCNAIIPDRVVARHLAAKGGKVTSEAKSEAARINGRLGGRPRETTGSDEGRQSKNA